MHLRALGNKTVKNGDLPVSIHNCYSIYFQILDIPSFATIRTSKCFVSILFSPEEAWYFLLLLHLFLLFNFFLAVIVKAMTHLTGINTVWTFECASDLFDDI